MKNLKKLSVVLFATLLSFNFTSCIDDGVSDAVDQVYLAQAQFLLAQAGLKEAEAQHELANAAYRNALAAYELARAEVQLAYARETDAYTAGVLLDNEAQAELNAFNAQKNIMLLAELEAQLEVTLLEEMTNLAEAQSAHDVAMVNLGEAVAQAKDLLVLTYYAQYDVVIDDLQDLYEDKILAEHDLAMKELMLVGLADGDPLTTVDQVSMAYYQAILEGDLANLEADLVAEQDWLAILEAVTPDDASDYQKSVSAIDDEIAALQADWDALVIEKAEKFNARDQAWEAWDASTAHYQELMDAQDLYDLAVAAKKEHTDAIEDAQEAIAEAEANIAAKPALLAAIEAVDTTTAYDAIQAQIALIGQEDNGGAGENDWDDGWPDVNGHFFGDDSEDLATGTSLYDLWWNAAVAEETAEDALECANFMMSDQGGYPFHIQDLEEAWAAAEALLADYVPGMTIADLEAEVLAANAEEEVAQENFELDPDGFQEFDGAVDVVDDLGNLGISGDGSDVTYMQVITWAETFSGSTFWYPSEFAPTKYTLATLDAFITTVFAAENDLITAAGIPYSSADPIGEWDIQDDGNDIRLWHGDGAYYDEDGDVNPPVFVDPDGLRSIAEVRRSMSIPAGEEHIRRMWFVEVEEDDTSDSNFDILQEARFWAAFWQLYLDFENGEIGDLGQAAAEARADVAAGYACLGYDIDDAEFGTLDYSDFLAILDYIDGLEDALDDANDDENDAEDDLQDGKDLLGTDFRDSDSDDDDWTNLWTIWYGQTPFPALPLVFDDYSAPVGFDKYQQLWDVINAAGDEARLYKLPHTGSSVTLYEDLRNAYFQRVWAIEAYEACLEVTYDSYLEGDDFTDSNADVITQAGEDIAALEALMPSHDFAIEYLLSEVERLADIFDIDVTLWDFEVDHGLGMLYDLPLYAAYLDAMNAYNFVLHQFDLIDGQIDDLEFLRGAYVFLQPGTGFGSAESVGAFMGMIGGEITATMTAIADLEDDIEVQTQLVATGMVNAETAQAWIAECQRQLDLLDTEIEGFEAAAASLLARINALLAG